jgi:hypothetical protein
MKNLVKKTIVLGFVLFASLWVAQSYRPIVMTNSFNSPTHTLGHDGGDLTLRLLAVGQMTGRGDDFYLIVGNDRASMLPPPGPRQLWEITDGRFCVVRGTISAEPPPSDQQSSVKIAITQDRSWPLWPILLMLSIGCTIILIRAALRRREWMVETYRTPHLHRRTSILSGVLFMLCGGLYLAQRITVITLHHNIGQPSGTLSLDKHMQWDLGETKDIEGFVSTGSVSNAGIRKLQIQLQPNSTWQLPARSSWLVCIGHDGVRLMTTTVDPPVERRGFLFAYVADPRTVAQFPILLAVVAAGMWFALRTVVPSFTYIKRKRNGLCLKCGYDLRGSSEACPECGTTALRASADAPTPSHSRSSQD